MRIGRAFGRAAVALILCLTMMLSGCSTDWIGQAEQIAAVLIPATGNLVTLVASLQGKTVSALDLQVVQSAGSQAAADLQLIQSLIAAYEKADAAAKPGILSQIQNAIQAVQENLQGLLPALHIKDAAMQAKITAVVGILLSEVQSMAAIVPVIQGSGIRAQGLAASVQKRNAPLSASEFVSAYNATLTAKTGNADLDRVAGGLRIHAHGTAARVVSGGVLK
jgi:hypothetical protein